ncbi:PBS lyase HEAT domain protein repeat-containing protein (plasmid) [Thalassoporum mexicanum PCC 7367]|uniref:HEAT repeat domain-containing protein n=1 Tax=Thalassoporum mexicanum TaxID=3457544 RepID=UPI00029FA8C4|nr:HEAT repeat domain-containing protein [Pseudanabaena sp. PCC 7367]AFY72110.1 PBS lyase HEAT domain protein repeat-containing protein [Pseudanabaena sp. PCC 7367]
MSTDALFEQLKHPNPNLRDRAMWELVDHASPEVIDKLMSLLSETDTTYRRAAVKTLGAIGADTVSPLAAALLNSDDVTVRGSAAKAIAQVVINHPDQPLSEEGVQALKTALGDANPVVNIGAVMALERMGTPAVEILIEALQTTDNPALALPIVNAIASIGDQRGVVVLQSIVEDEATDAYVREAANSALARLDLTSSFERREYPS